MLRRNAPEIQGVEGLRPRVLADFAGRWTIARRIIQAGQPQARFEGIAEWTPSGADLAYHEEGFLHLAGQPPIRAQRRYLWKPDLSVWFEDGRLFHHVPPTGGGAEHWCAPDTYRVRYRFGQWPRFETTWRVTGPRKNYAMISTFAPDAEAGTPPNGPQPFR